MASSTTWSLNSSPCPQVTTLRPLSKAHSMLQANHRSSNQRINSSKSMIFYLSNKNSNANRSIKIILQSMCSLVRKQTTSRTNNTKLPAKQLSSNSRTSTLINNRALYRSTSSSLWGRNSRVAQNRNYILSRPSLSLNWCCRSTLKNCWPAIRLPLSKRQPL